MFIVRDGVDGLNDQHAATRPRNRCLDNRNRLPRAARGEFSAGRQLHSLRQSTWHRHFAWRDHAQNDFLRQWKGFENAGELDALAVAEAPACGVAVFGLEGTEGEAEGGEDEKPVCADRGC